MAKLKLNQQIFDLIYPVGSVYLTVNDVNPQTLFGGTWVKSSGGFIYGSTATGTKGENGNGTGTSVSSAGGGNTGSTTLTIAQIPKHNHSMPKRTAKQVDFNMGYDVIHYSGEMYPESYQITMNTADVGGGQGHTHTLSNHSHNIPYFACYIWRRTA